MEWGYNYIILLTYQDNTIENTARIVAGVMKKTIIGGIEVHTQDIEINEDSDELVLLGIASILFSICLQL